jgi:pyruvate,water dikinase
MVYALPFSRIGNGDIGTVGGKNASLGELVQTFAASGVRIPEGFALTAAAFNDFLTHNQLTEPLHAALARLDRASLSNLAQVGAACRALVMQGTLPGAVRQAVVAAYQALSATGPVAVAVRSSATAEDLPSASFAGQHDSFLNIAGIDALLTAVLRCYASLFNDRAIKYREDHSFPHDQVALSVGVQRMVRSDLGSAGVAFTLDPESGNRNVVYLTSSWGLGENVVQGAVTPDEFYLFKAGLGRVARPIVRRSLGAKEQRMVYAKQGPRPTVNEPTSAAERAAWSISDADVATLGCWCVAIEKHYGCPMDIEWARDGESGELFIVQARPETVHASETTPSIKDYSFKTDAMPLCTGMAVGRKIACGRVRRVASLADSAKVREGDVIVADSTNPDWNTLLRKAICIVTNKGGRTSHASIVARELGIHAVVGTGNATEVLQDDQIITVSCLDGDKGHVYAGALPWKEWDQPLTPHPPTCTCPLLILSDPDKALHLARYPSQGVGLLRMEFIITHSVRVHPMALIHFDLLGDAHARLAILELTRGFADKRRYFIQTLAEAVGLVAAAFHPREVIVRMSDFKTNEYAQLLGGAQFEPKEENPMLGFRGASRYYHSRYRAGFGLECEAMRMVRDEMGLTNVKLMIPFCRTLEEGRQVLSTMAAHGLQRGENGLEVYVMAELPSNVILATAFAELFDGFSIGSNDLTQLILGIDRDSSLIKELFDENNPAVKEALATMIAHARAAGIPIGLCGQAPSDHPDFARFLVELGIDSISFNADALFKGIENIRAAEGDVTPPCREVAPAASLSTFT